MFGGLAVANALPQTVQTKISDAASRLGIHLPSPSDDSDQPKDTLTDGDTTLTTPGATATAPTTAVAGDSKWRRPTTAKATGAGSGSSGSDGGMAGGTTPHNDAKKSTPSIQPSTTQPVVFVAPVDPPPPDPTTTTTPDPAPPDPPADPPPAP